MNRRISVISVRLKTSGSIVRTASRLICACVLVKAAGHTHVQDDREVQAARGATEDREAQVGGASNEREGADVKCRRVEEAAEAFELVSTLVTAMCSAHCCRQSERDSGKFLQSERLSVAGARRELQVLKASTPCATATRECA